MGRPKGSKNKPKNSTETIVKPPKPDKKVNFTLLNQFLAAGSELLKEVTAGIRAEREAAEANMKFMNALAGNMTPVGQTGPVPETATVVTDAESALKEAASGDAVEQQSGTDSGDGKSAATDLGAIFGTEDSERK